MNRALSVPLIPNKTSSTSKNQNGQNQPETFNRYKKQDSVTSIHLRQKLPSAGHLNHRRQLTGPLSGSNAVKKLKNFIKKDQITDSYVKEFVHLKKSSFFLNNKLTKSVFDINDAAMIGKPQPLNTFRSIKNYNGQSQISSLKNAVKNITKDKKSHIPRLYQKSLSLSSFSTKKDELNLSSERTFFPTTALQKTTTYEEKKGVKTGQISGQLKLSKKKPLEPARLAKPLSQRKIIKIDHKLTELKHHNQSMHKLIPTPIVKPEKVIIKGKGEIVSQDKIIRIIDKLLSVIELYFQMHGQNGVRVYDFLKNVEGFENEKIAQCLCEGESVKMMKSADELRKYFWVFRAQEHHQNKNSQNKSFKLPQFFGEQDYALYKVFNNFILKLESKYENHHKQKFKKNREIAVQNESKEFNSLYSATNESTESYNFSSKKTQNISKSLSKDKSKSIMSISSNKHSEHTDRKAFMNKIKFNPLNNDRKISNQIGDLEDLGVKFDFKQKGRSIILSERSKIIFSKR